MGFIIAIWTISEVYNFVRTHVFSRAHYDTLLYVTFFVCHFNYSVHTKYCATMSTIINRSVKLVSNAAQNSWFIELLRWRILLYFAEPLLPPNLVEKKLHRQIINCVSVQIWLLYVEIFFKPFLAYWIYMKTFFFSVILCSCFDDVA